MLPTRLELKNFLAYRNPDPIIFDGLHLACLSGPNGAGKSSILDAITWAIWGKARGRSDDDMIHIGQEEMQVALEFIQGDQRYRITRKRRLGGMRKDGSRAPGASTLDFFAWDPDKRAFRLINEPSLRRTEERIVELLRMEYETFVNSAFVQQGKADAFTAKSPAERKRILAEILGLEQWGYYEEQAKHRLHEISSEVGSIETRLADYERDIAEEPALRREFEVVDAQVEALREQVLIAEASFRELSGADADLSAAESELRTLKRQIHERERDIALAEEEVRRNHEMRARHQAIVDQRESIQAGYAKLTEAQEANQALSDALHELTSVERRINELTLQISAARQQIELDIASAQTLIEEAERTATTSDTVQAEYENVYGEIVALEHAEARRQQLQTDIAALREEDAALRTQNKALKGEMEIIRERLDLIEATTEPRCPVCRQPLDETHRSHVIEQFQTEGRERGDSYRANDQRTKAIGAEIKERQEQIREIEQTLPQLTFLRNRLGGLEQQNRDAEQAILRAQEQRAHLEQLQEVLDSGEFAQELHIQLQAAREERDRLGYDRAEHEAVRATLHELRGYQEQATALEVALQSIPNIEASLTAAQERVNRWQASLVELHERVRRLEEDMVGLEARVLEMRRREVEWTHQRTLERQASEKRTSLKQKLGAIEDLRRRQQQLMQRQKYLGEQQGVYEQLRNAFGKNGIPAMIIEAAIPELEESANRLLHRMTDGRMVVRFDTQREKKTGGVAETFDIWISDELGTRDYSLFSGGEAFRVNFAIRVAVSQLLARRAGAQLRTLFIDEGFGTQDDVGRERLIEALTAIQEDFDLVLVITHIDELRDAFPVRLEVEKLPQGSRVRMV